VDRGESPRDIPDVLRIGVGNPFRFPGRFVVALLRPEQLRLTFSLGSQSRQRLLEVNGESVDGLMECALHAIESACMRPRLRPIPCEPIYDFELTQGACALAAVQLPARQVRVDEGLGLVLRMVRALAAEGTVRVGSEAGKVVSSAG